MQLCIYIKEPLKLLDISIRKSGMIKSAKIEIFNHASLGEISFT